MKVCKATISQRRLIIKVAFVLITTPFKFNQYLSATSVRIDMKIVKVVPWHVLVNLMFVRVEKPMKALRVW